LSEKIDIAFDIRNLTKKYGQVKALNNVSLKVLKGKITSIYGPNGAGKSTLLKILCGEVKNYFGTVFFRNNMIEFSSNIDALKAGISYVPQDFGLIPNLTGRENISVSVNQLKKKVWYWSDNIDLFTERIDLKFDRKILDEKISNLTSYEKQLVAIYKALSFNSNIYIFDECTTNFNQIDFKSFSDILFELKAKGKTVIFISHKIDEVFKVADDIVVLKEGRLVSHLDKDSISKDDMIYGFISETPNSKNNKNRKYKKSSYHIHFKNRRSFDVNFELKTGEVVAIETNSTADNHSIGYEIFDWLTKHSSIVSGIIPGSRDTEGIFPNLSVKGNLLMNAHQHQNSILITDKIQKSIKRVVAKLDLRYEDWEQNISELSGGNQQKVVFARWMIADFDIMVLIEPTSGIDLKSKEIIHDTILEMVRDGKSFILITSDEGEKIKLKSKTIELPQLC